MSAIRSSSHRAEARKQRSLPYHRKIANFLLRPFGYIAVEDVEALVSNAVDEINRHRQPESIFTTSTSENGPAPLDNTHREPITNSSRDPLATANLANIAQLESSSVSQRTKPESRDVNHNMDVDNAAHSFVFTYSAPGSSSFSTLSEAARNDTPTTTPKRKLAKNPNGNYRWEGAGSAKHTRPRNRYGTPAFGASPSKSDRDASTFPSTPLDNKRRKVGEEATTPSRQSASDGPVSFPTSTPPRANGIPPKPTPLPSSRLRTPAKPTTPVVPSPLRQAWSDSPSPSSRDEVPPIPSKQTNTANLMAELIKETTPVKKPDLSNPYQTANPVGKVGPPRRGTKRPRATGKPTVPAKEEGTTDNKKEETKGKPLKEYSAQAIIEATLPKGSKRSRPPAHFEKRASSSEEAPDIPVAQREPPVIVETRKQVYIVEEPDEDQGDSARAFKKPKSSTNGSEATVSTPVKSASVSRAEITVEEIEDDVVMEDASMGKGKGKETELPKAPVPVQTVETPSTFSLPASSGATARSLFGGSKPSSIPKEPSKLRFSFQAESSSTPPSPGTFLTPPPLPKSDFKFSPPSDSFSFSFKAEAKATSPTSQPDSPKEKSKASSDDVVTTKAKVRAVDVSSLSQFVFTVTAASVLSGDSDHLKAQNLVKALPESSLPIFELEPRFSFGYDPSTKSNPSYIYKPSPPKPPKYGIPFGSPASNITSVPVASVPTIFRPVASATPVAFDYAAAKMEVKPIEKGTWTCPNCLLSKPPSATKCETCDTSAPSASSPSISEPKAVSQTPSAPSVVPFNWAAAGLPIQNNKGTWQCSSCSLLSPDSASNCVACNTPKPTPSH